MSGTACPVRRPSPWWTVTRSALSVDIVCLISRQFGLKLHQSKDLQKALRDENHATTLALKALGVTYGSEGKGPKGKSFLVKAA